MRGGIFCPPYRKGTHDQTYAGSNPVRQLFYLIERTTLNQAAVNLGVPDSGLDHVYPSLGGIQLTLSELSYSEGFSTIIKGAANHITRGVST